MSLSQENRWAARPRTAAALRLAIYLFPFLASGVAARIAQTALRTNYPGMHWSIAATLSLPVAALVLVAVGRVMRRLLPLALLLKLSLLFPDQIPGRLGIALRAASTKRLAAKLAAAEGDDVHAVENILALVAALGAHDRRTRGHSERVRAVTMLLADEIGLKGEDRDKLEWASLLHDLGKLDVPGEILNKNGRPTEAEWNVLRQHPGNGPAHAEALSVWLGDWIHAMDQHHERFDGTGYPVGLTGDHITLSGRIVAVSDAFEVMTATRSYKKPMTTQAARDELVACAGTHFDPAIVRSFMAISIGDIHRALGPGSWLASIPFVGTVTNSLGAGTGAALLGGSISPALAATVALLLTSPTVGTPSTQNLDTPAALAHSTTEVAEDGSEIDELDVGSDTTAGEDRAESQRSRDESAEKDGAIGPDPTDHDDPDSLPDDSTGPGAGGGGSQIVDVVPITVDIDDTIDTVGVLAGGLLNELGIDDVVEPLVEELGLTDEIEGVNALVDGVAGPIDDAVGEVLDPVGDTTGTVTDPIVEPLIDSITPPATPALDPAVPPTEPEPETLIEELTDPAVTPIIVDLPSFP